MILRSLFVLLIVISHPSYSEINISAGEKVEFSWSKLKIEPGQVVSVEFQGLNENPEDLRFWINDKPIYVIFDVVKTGENLESFSDDLVIAYQYIPILTPGKYTIGIGNSEGSYIEPRELTILQAEPRHKKEQVAETLATGFRLIARDIAAVSRPGKAGFGYYRERALSNETIASLQKDLEILIEEVPSIILEDYGTLSQKQETQIQAMLINMQILPALERILKNKIPKNVPLIEAKKKYLLYIEFNSAALYEFGERFKLLHHAIRNTSTSDHMVLREMLIRLPLLWEILKNTKLDLLAYFEKHPPEDDGDDPRDTPPPIIYGEEIDTEDSCRVKVQCHWALASGRVSAWFSKKIIGQYHCAIFTRIDTDPTVRLGQHIQGNGFTGVIESIQFQTDVGFAEVKPDYWDYWDSYSMPMNSCPMAQCLRTKARDFEGIFKTRPYDGLADGWSETSDAHPNSTAFIGAMVDSCSVPSPLPRTGIMHRNPLMRWDYIDKLTGWYYWNRAEPPAEYWQGNVSAKTRPVIFKSSLGYWLWWNS